VGEAERIDRGLTRRRLIGGGAAAAGGYAVGGLAAESAEAAKRVDVVVVGAGLAGLAAGQALKKAGVSFVVLEARDRVGGRTLNRKLKRGGEIAEIGGQWVGPTQDRVLALIDELGLELFDTYVDGANVYYRQDASIKRQTYTGTIPPANPASLVELLTVINDLNTMSQEVPPDAPWQAPSAAAWDAQTFETWKLDNTTTPEARDLVDLAVESVFSAQPADLSLLHVLFYIRAAGNFNRLIDTAGGAQESRIVGGSQLISRRLAKKLGSSVVLSEPVERIEHAGREVTVTTKNGRWRASRAIVAIPPALAGRLAYSPELPPNRDQITQRMPMGTVIKCMAVYERPFWRDDGLSGMATSDLGPVKLTFDNSPPDGSPGILLGFIEGQEGRDLADTTARQRKGLVCESFARYFGPSALEPVEYFDKSWAADQWTRGCYAGYAPPGVITGYREAIREPVGRLHWAGTETATVWNGYMDGAIESGQRAAAEVLAKL
jgi:monoamine oxidase